MKLKTFIIFGLITSSIIILQSKAFSKPQAHNISQYKSIKKRNSFGLKGNASWYGSAWNNKKTASGQLFNSKKLTAAHKTLPLGSKVKVKSLETGKSVIVTINDRGPFIKNRIIDLSKRSAEILGISKKGVSKVIITPIEVASFNK